MPYDPILVQPMREELSSIGVKELRRRITDAIADVLIQLVWNLAPNVVGLEAINGNWHVT